MTVRFSPAAARQTRAPEAHYSGLGRESAIANLRTAITTAVAAFDRTAARDYDAPRPYPELAHLGWRWMHQGRYWVAFDDRGPDLYVAAVVFDSADIPARVQSDAD